MNDLIGTTLGHYRIDELLGKGGMGEVYRARDQRLDRDVAIKVLPEEVAGVEDRLARFEREAKLLASLSHSNIATLHGLEEEGNSRFLVMELVKGESLAAAITRGAIPVDHAVPIAIQIAQALEAAHEHGIMHRDLKPANVMVNATGEVKVLDFGLAKAFDPGASSAMSAESIAESPTITVGMTRAGVLLGTAAYMSPEQARGRDVDTRSDIWAFGVVLWEMLTGLRLFAGEAVSDVLASVLRDDPDWQALPGTVPPAVHRLLRRCLRRDPARRLRHIGDARIELEEAFEEPATVTTIASSPQLGAVSTEHFWTLTADVCRHLTRESLNPAIIGDHLLYTDNERSSDALVVYVPGFGFDHDTFREILISSPFRGIAVTMYGFEESRRRRIPLPIADHLTLLRLFLKSIKETAKPKTTVLCGFSAGADIVLRMIAEGGVDNGLVDGVLPLSPNLGLRTCFLSLRVAEIPDDDDEEIFSIARELAAAMPTPQEWLQVNPYLMELVRKYHTDIDVLRFLGRDLVAPCLEGDGSPFAGWYRSAKEAGVEVRVVFAGAEESEQDTLREVMLSHVDHHVLGPDFYDGDIVSEPDASHMGLMNTEVINRHLEELMEILRAKNVGTGK